MLKVNNRKIGMKCESSSNSNLKITSQKNTASSLYRKLICYTLQLEIRYALTSHDSHEVVC